MKHGKGGLLGNRVSACDESQRKCTERATRPPVLCWPERSRARSGKQVGLNEAYLRGRQVATGLDHHADHPSVSAALLKRTLSCRPAPAARHPGQESTSLANLTQVAGAAIPRGYPVAGIPNG
jgi:hypothetical protein